MKHNKAIQPNKKGREVKKRNKNSQLKIQYQSISPNSLIHKHFLELRSPTKQIPQICPQLDSGQLRMTDPVEILQR